MRAAPSSSALLTAEPGEQFLHDGDVCNLGAINLEKFASPSGGLDSERLRSVTKTAVQMLDNVIDLYHFPVEKVI